MKILLADALDRTLLLMRDSLVPTVENAQLIAALTATEVALVADARNLASHAAQCAYITAAMLMARSGHRVYLAAPDVALVGAQPPLTGTQLVSGLLDVGRDLLPGIEFSVGVPDSRINLSVSFGDSGLAVPAHRAICVNATVWSAHMGSPMTAQRWQERDWPFGALAVGALIATEAFKAAMHVLRPFATDELLFEALFAFSDDLCVELAPCGAPKCASFGEVDFVSGGAITNAVLFVLTRLPQVTGRGRVVEPDVTDGSNLNRYALLCRSGVGQPKARLLRLLLEPYLELEALDYRYEGGQIARVGEFFPAVLVGADDIPVRWKVQEEHPNWLGVGATTHWSAMASFHARGMACARCLHPRDDPGNDRIPTVAFVSFFSGLLLACYFARTVAGEDISLAEQQVYLSPLRLERIWRSPVSARPDCPLCGQPNEVRAA
jgi:hypothetical protein